MSNFLRNTGQYRAQLAEQEQEVAVLQIMREHLEHAKRSREIQEEFHDLIDHRFNPQIKTWGETLSQSKDVIVRREERLYYAICPSATCSIIASYGQVTRTLASVVGWTPVVLPDNARLTLSTGPDVPALVMVMNVPLIVAATTVI